MLFAPRLLRRLRAQRARLASLRRGGWGAAARRWRFAALTLCLAGSAAAEESESAGLLYEQGLQYLEEGRYEAAAERFARAYAERPEYRVLYNLGQAYLALSRLAEGVAALQQYLTEGGAQLPAERIAEVRRALEVHRRRIAYVRFSLEPADAEVLIDGRRVAEPHVSEPVALSDGTHGVVVRKPGYLPHVSTLRLQGGEQQALSIRLRESPSPSAALLVRCEVPAVRVLIDGQPVATTPVEAPLVLAAGIRQLRFEREGYSPREQSLRLAGDRGQSVHCDLKPLATSLASAGGALSVTTNAPRPRLWLDGARYDGTRVPSGAHVLRVEAIGYQPRETRVSVPSNGTRTVELQLAPLAEYQADRARSRLLAEEHQAQRRVLASVVGGTGVALGATAAALALVANDSFDEWERTQARLRESQGAERQALRARSNQLVRKVNHLERWTIGLGTASALLVAGAITAWVVTSEDASGLNLSAGHDSGSLAWRGAW